MLSEILRLGFMHTETIIWLKLFVYNTYTQDPCLLLENELDICKFILNMLIKRHYSNLPMIFREVSWHLEHSNGT